MNFLRRVLLDDSRRLQQEHERRGTAVHDRELGTGDVDVHVVDAEAGARRQHVLDGRDRHAVLLQRRREARVADVLRVGRES